MCHRPDTRSKRTANEEISASPAAIAHAASVTDSGYGLRLAANRAKGKGVIRIMPDRHLLSAVRLKIRALALTHLTLIRVPNG